MAGARRGGRQPGKSDPIDAEAGALAALRHDGLPAVVDVGLLAPAPPRKVSGKIPSCGPIRLHAALIDIPGSCRRASRTVRFARSRISSLNFLGAGTISTLPWDQSLHHTRSASNHLSHPLLQLW
jgi:hypothetical protein